MGCKVGLFYLYIYTCKMYTTHSYIPILLYPIYLVKRPGILIFSCKCLTHFLFPLLDSWIYVSKGKSAGIQKQTKPPTYLQNRVPGLTKGRRNLTVQYFASSHIVSGQYLAVVLMGCVYNLMKLGVSVVRLESLDTDNLEILLWESSIIYCYQKPKLHPA